MIRRFWRRLHRLPRYLRGLVVAAVAVAAVTAPVAAQAADETLVPAGDLSTPVPFTVVANEDITNRDLKAIRLANYTQVRTDGTVITGLDVTDAGYAQQIAAAITAAGIDTSNADPEAYDPANPMPWVMMHLLQASAAPWADADAPNLRAFLTQLRKQFTTANPNLPGTEYTLATPSDGASAEENAKRKSANVVPGVYLALDWTTTTAGNGTADAAAIPMLNGTGVQYTPSGGAAVVLDRLVNASGTSYTLGTVEYKVSDVTITKTVAGADGAPVSSNEAQIGDTVTFTLSTTVPNYTGYDRFQFKLTDTLSSGLTLGTITGVKIGDADHTADKGSIWTLVEHPDDPKADGGTPTFEIVFAPDAAQRGASNLVARSGDFPIGAAVTVTYTATLNQNAVIMGAGNTNTAAVLYSHNPNDDTDPERSVEETTTTYTGEVTLRKTDTSDKPLAGAVFSITRQGSDDPLPLIEASEGVYRVADAAERADSGTTKVTRMTTPANGNLTIRGLQGTYTIAETSSPFNNPLLPTFSVTVSTAPPAEGTDGDDSGTTAEGAGSAAAATAATTDAAGTDAVATAATTGQAVTVVSQPTGDLYRLVSAPTTAGASNVLVVRNARSLMDMPKTGAAWLALYAAGAALFVAGGLVLLVRSRRSGN